MDKLDAMKGTAKMDFQKGNPPEWSKLLQNPEAIPVLKAHDTRVQGLKARLAAHIQAHRMQWVADEADRLWRERGKPRLTHPAPNWAGAQPYETWLEQAKRNVQRRIEGRFERLSTIDERMREEIINRPKPREIEPIVLIDAKARHVRRQAVNYFNSQSEANLQIQETPRSRERELENFDRLDKRFTRIERARDKMISRLEPSAQETLAREPKTTLKQSFGQEM